MCVKLTLVIFVTYWNGFDDLVFDDLPRWDGLSSSSSEEHIGSADAVELIMGRGSGGSIEDRRAEGERCPKQSKPTDPAGKGNVGCERRGWLVTTRCFNTAQENPWRGRRLVDVYAPAIPCSWFRDRSEDGNLFCPGHAYL